MPNGLEIIKDVIEQFQKVQRHMLLAKKEHATETYNSLKKDYLSFVHFRNSPEALADGKIPSAKFMSCPTNGAFQNWDWKIAQIVFRCVTVENLSVS